MIWTILGFELYPTPVLVQTVIEYVMFTFTHIPLYIPSSFSLDWYIQTCLHILHSLRFVLSWLSIQLDEKKSITASIPPQGALPVQCTREAEKQKSQL